MKPEKKNRKTAEMSRRSFLQRASILTLGGIASVGLPFTGKAWACGTHEEVLNMTLSDGQQLKYRLRQTNGSRGLCYFVHGIGDASSSFTNIMESVISFGYDVLYYDMPGCGENNTVEVPFEDNCLILKNIMERHSHNGRRNYCIGHSLGGLVMLLTFAKYRPAVRQIKLMAVEPSMTLPDKQFFEWVQGIGYEGLLESVGTWTDLYAPTYAANLAIASQPLFEEYIQSVYDRFDEYSQQILTSDTSFTYIYGDNSSGTEYRSALASYPQIQVEHFANAAHWVHVDAEAAFTAFLETDFFRRKTWFTI